MIEETKRNIQTERALVEKRAEIRQLKVDKAKKGLLLEKERLKKELASQEVRSKRPTTNRDVFRYIPAHLQAAAERAETAELLYLETRAEIRRLRVEKAEAGLLVRKLSVAAEEERREKVSPGS